MASHRVRSARACAAIVGALALALAGATLAACDGPGSPSVARLGTHGTTSGSGTPTAQVGDGATTLLDRWAACMRRHGDPGQVDPRVTQDKVIDITWNPAIPGGPYGTQKGGRGNTGPGQYCRTYLTKAQDALRGGPIRRPSTAKVEEFSRCMRAEGITDFPDPGPDGSLSLPANAGGHLSLNNPAFQHASRVCSHRVGVPGLGGGGAKAGTIELTGAAPP